MHAAPSAGLPGGAVNPTGHDPRRPPRRHPVKAEPCGRRGAEWRATERSGAPALTKPRRLSVGWSMPPVGSHARETTRRAAMPREAECGQTFLQALRALEMATSLGALTLHAGSSQM